jgi:hypothetical protein
MTHLGLIDWRMNWFAVVQTPLPANGSIQNEQRGNQQNQRHRGKQRLQPPVQRLIGGFHGGSATAVTVGGSARREFSVPPLARRSSRPVPDSATMRQPGR